MHGLQPWDVDKGIVELANFMDIRLIWKVEFTKVSSCLLTWAFLINVHHSGDGSTLLRDELLGKYQEMSIDIQSLSVSKSIHIRRKKNWQISGFNPTRMVKFNSTHHTSSLHG